MNTSEQHKVTRRFLVNLIYFSDRFRLITQTSSRKMKELTLYLMIKAKSRFCNGANCKKHPQNIRAGYDYNPAVKLNIAIYHAKKGADYVR